jgi:hypothetical protein
MPVHNDWTDAVYDPCNDNIFASGKCDTETGFDYYDYYGTSWIYSVPLWCPPPCYPLDIPPGYMITGGLNGGGTGEEIGAEFDPNSLKVPKSEPGTTVICNIFSIIPDNSDPESELGTDPIVFAKLEGPGPIVNLNQNNGGVEYPYVNNGVEDKNKIAFNVGAIDVTGSYTLTATFNENVKTLDTYIATMTIEVYAATQAGTTDTVFTDPGGTARAPDGNGEIFIGSTEINGWSMSISPEQIYMLDPATGEMILMYGLNSISNITESGVYLIYYYDGTTLKWVRVWVGVQAPVDTHVVIRTTGEGMAPDDGGNVNILRATGTELAQEIVISLLNNWLFILYDDISNYDFTSDVRGSVVKVFKNGIDPFTYNSSGHIDQFQPPDFYLIYYYVGTELRWLRIKFYDLYYPDTDGDSHGDGGTVVKAPYSDDSSITIDDATYVHNNTDPDDNNPNTYPGAPEICDGLDNNNNGQIDEGLSPQNIYYQDADGDGYGNAAVTQVACAAPPGYIPERADNKFDCNDSISNINPGATVIPNNTTDENCDGLLEYQYYRDADEDGFGDNNNSTIDTSQPAGYVLYTHIDCDDTNASINPDATEIIDDGIDNNCDGLYANTFYQDSDNDQYGGEDELTPTKVSTNLFEPGYWPSHDDCNDSDASINPGATEICGDGIDQNCESGDDLLRNCWLDNDGDTYGDDYHGIDETVFNCGACPAGKVDRGGDCDDNDASINQGAGNCPP